MGKLYPLNVYQIILLYPVGFYTWEVFHLQIEHFESVNRKVVKRYVELFNRAGGKVNVRVSKQPSCLPYKINDIGEGLRVQFLVSGNSQLVREFERLKSEDSYVMRHTVLKLTLAKILYLLQVLEKQKLNFNFWKKHASKETEIGTKGRRQPRWQRQRERRQQQTAQQLKKGRQPTQREIARLKETKLQYEQKRRFRRFQRDQKLTQEQIEQQEQLAEEKRKRRKSRRRADTDELDTNERREERHEERQEGQHAKRRKKRRTKRRRTEQPRREESKRSTESGTEPSVQETRETSKPTTGSSPEQDRLRRKKSKRSTESGTEPSVQETRETSKPTTGSSPEQDRLRRKKKPRNTAGGWLSEKTFWTTYGDLKWSKALYRRFPQYLAWTWTFRNWFKDNKKYRKRPGGPRPRSRPRPRYNDTVQVQFKKP